MKAGYLVVARVSMTTKRICRLGHRHWVTYGPYKRLKRARKQATRMRQSRQVYYVPPDWKEVKDYGPSYERGTVKIVDATTWVEPEVKE